MKIWNASGIHLNYVYWEGASFPVYEIEPFKIKYNLILRAGHPMCSARYEWDFEFPFQLEEGELKAGDIILINKDLIPLARELKKELILLARGVVDVFVIDPSEIKEDNEGRRYVDSEGLYEV